MITKPDLLNSRYIFFVLSQPEYQWELVSIATGSANQVNISGKQIESLMIPIPPPEEQRKITELLGAIDDKIELNRQMNNTLENIARVLFKSWFVDFDPVRAKIKGRQPYGMEAETAELFPDAFEDSALREIPRGWKTGTVRDCCIRVENGSTPSRNTPSSWSPKTIPWLTSGEVYQKIIISTNSFISEDGFRNSSTKLWPLGTTIVALYGATTGQASLLAREMCANQACCGLIPDNFMQYYIYLHLAFSTEDFKRLARGSAQQNISQQIVADFSTLIPDLAVLKCFHKRVSPLFEKWASNLEESQTLTAIRDALLPKLLSGQFRVRDAEKLVECAV
jgi:type I restriction enzyme S subunit